MQPTGYEWAEDVARILERTTDYQSTEKESEMAMISKISKCVFDLFQRNFESRSEESYT